MNTAMICQAAEAIRAAIIAHEPEIESLDRAIGDGDHYINMKRGSEAIAAMLDELGPLPAVEALNKIGLKLLSTIGGASGPLLASFFMAMSKAAKEGGLDSTTEIAASFSAGVEAIIHRGKARLGEKTMLDVLIPVSETFTTAAKEGKSTADICRLVEVSATQGLESTRNILATKGRAAGLGERAKGHLDPGAKSCEVMVKAVCNLWVSQ